MDRITLLTLPEMNECTGIYLIHFEDNLHWIYSANYSSHIRQEWGPHLDTHYVRGTVERSV